MNEKFSWQIFFSIGLLISFIVLVFSGIVLYAAPEGSLSRWIGWEVFCLSKKQWEHQHTIFSYLFILFSLFHIFKINWGLLLSYFTPEKINIKYLKEILLVLLICVLIFAGTLFNVTPLNKIITLGDFLSESHSKNVEIPLVNDSEKLSLADFSYKVLATKYSKVEEVLINLDFGSVSRDILVKDLCELNDITPEQFYKILKEELVLLRKSGSTMLFPEMTSPGGYTNQIYSML